MKISSFTFASLALLTWTGVCGQPSPTTSTEPPQPAFKPQEPTPAYIPHATYPYADAFGSGIPYNGFVYQPAPSYPIQNVPAATFIQSIMPTAQAALQIALRLFARVGLFLIGGVALLAVGGIFTTAVCSLTPFCTITFAGFGGIDKDSMRSLMSPDRISAAAALVQDAIGKYQRLQRAVGN